MSPDPAKSRIQAARDLLAFYAEAGVDAAVGEMPNNCLSTDSEVPTSAGPSSAAPKSRRDLVRPTASPDRPIAPIVPPAPAVPEAAVMAAREAARSAQSLDELRGILDRFEGCALKATASQLVFADGNPQARLMLVGEAPGRDEDIEGLPFVGRSGKLLDRMLAAIGLNRSAVYIANIVPWRPPGNRTPTPVETQICLPFLMRQIELSGAEILVTMGNPSTQTLLNTSDGITKTRGRWFEFRTGERSLRAMPTFHPAYLLRTPLAKRLAWRDFLAIKNTLG
jgi:DNA polymerase